MGQRPARRASGFLTLLASLALMLGACDESTPPSSSFTSTTATTTAPASRALLATVASLSPAATEILIGMGAGDRLVAVSNFDPPRDETEDLPRVGDYQTTDWERLATLRPRVMVTQFAPDRLPQGLMQKARTLDIDLVNVPITRLEDIYSAMRTLGQVIDQPQLGAAAADELRQRFAVLREKCDGRKVPTLIVLDDAGKGVAGRENYLNDALEAAGGVNVMHGSSPYPSIDREMLLELDPEVIFQLLPDASPQVRAAAQQLWRSMPNLQAVRSGRVHVFTDSWVLRPSHHIADLAERFAVALNEARPATQPAAATTGLPLSRYAGRGQGEGSARGPRHVNAHVYRAERSPQPSPGVPGEGAKAGVVP